MAELGDYVERSDWFWDERSKFIAEKIIAEAIAYCLNELGADHTEIEWETLKLGDPRIDGDPPRSECYLRIGCVRITKLPIHLVTNTPLSKDLEPEDLLKMRIATRQAHSRNYPHLSVLTDDQCDIIIDEIGPSSAVKGILSS